MKKLTALCLAVLLCIGCAVGVQAETAFAEISRVQNGATVQVSYTLPEGTELVEVIIGGQVCPITEKTTTGATIDLAPLTVGLYRDILYAYGTSSVDAKTSTVSGAPLTVAGDMKVTLSAEYTADGRLMITATDENELPVQGYRLSLDLAGYMEQRNTDEKGQYCSIYTIPVGSSAAYRGLETIYGESGLKYLETDKQTLVREGAASSSTQTTTSATVAVEATTASTAVKTTSTTSPVVTIWGAGTTVLADNKVAMNATTDSTLLEALGWSRSEFDSKVRFLLAQADYKSILDGSSDSLMLNLKMPQTPITDVQVQMAFAGVSDFANYDETSRVVLSFDASLLRITKAGKLVAIKELPENVVYTIQMPVPSPMKKCDALAIAMIDANGLTKPQLVSVKNGMFELQVTSLESYTLIGLNEYKTNKAGGVSWMLTLVLVVGILLLGGAGTLLYFFVFRKPAVETVSQPKAEIPPETDTDIYSGRPDVWKPEDN